MHRIITEIFLPSALTFKFDNSQFKLQQLSTFYYSQLRNYIWLFSIFVTHSSTSCHHLAFRMLPSIISSLLKVNAMHNFKKYRKAIFLNAQNFILLLALMFVAHSHANEFPRWDTAITKYNETQVNDFHPKFDFDSDGCYAATPFHRNENLRQNPGLNATGTPWGACRDRGWENYANTIHRQLCRETMESGNRIERCAHFYELYFEKDQAMGYSFLFGHRHDVETVIVWTGKINGQAPFVSHTSVSSHGKFSTRPTNQIEMHNGHPLVVYHKDGAGTHAFRFASSHDRNNVEFLGNSGQFYAPNILSHYRAVSSWSDNQWTRYDANRHYRLVLENSNFGSGSFKTRNDGEILNQANNSVPRSDSFWANTWFSWDDVWATRAKEFQANYPSIHQQIGE